MRLRTFVGHALCHANGLVDQTSGRDVLEVSEVVADPIHTDAAVGVVLLLPVVAQAVVLVVVASRAWLAGRESRERRWSCVCGVVQRRKGSNPCVPKP